MKLTLKSESKYINKSKTNFLLFQKKKKSVIKNEQLAYSIN